MAVIKLNGGLATSMGLRLPKSLVQARDGRSFLEIIVGQTLALRRRHGVRLPLVLMDSDATQRETLAALAAHPDLAVDGLALDFLQDMLPKLDAADAAAGELARRAARSSGIRPDTALSTARCAAPACSTGCVSAASAT